MCSEFRVSYIIMHKKPPQAMKTRQRLFLKTKTEISPLWKWLFQLIESLQNYFINLIQLFFVSRLDFCLLQLQMFCSTLVMRYLHKKDTLSWLWVIKRTMHYSVAILCNNHYCNHYSIVGDHVFPPSLVVFPKITFHK